MCIRDRLYEGHTPEEAAALVWKELRLGEEDLPVFRLILADVQWKLGQMTEDTLRNALEVLDNGAAMAEWEGASESDRRSRQRVLDRLRKKLESPQGPPKTVKRPKPKKFKFRIGDVISICFMPCFADRNPEFEMYRNKYFMVQVVGYTDHPTSCNRHPSIEQCGDLVVLDWMGDAIPDMEAFEDAPMLDLKEALYWFTRSFIIAGTVSYTHLDVYKRQALTRMESRPVSPSVILLTVSMYPSRSAKLCCMSST